MRAPKRALLGRGSVPSGLNEENPAIVTMATVVTAKLDETYEIHDR
jgi:hypothetical protein